MILPEQTEVGKSKVIVIIPVISIWHKIFMESCDALKHGSFKVQ